LIVGVSSCLCFFAALASGAVISNPVYSKQVINAKSCFCCNYHHVGMAHFNVMQSNDKNYFLEIDGMYDNQFGAGPNS
jgi:hypothetical protein